jgi:hypothetical protein
MTLFLSVLQTFFVKAKVPQIAEVSELPFLERTTMLSGDNPRYRYCYFHPLRLFLYLWCYCAVG